MKKYWLVKSEGDCYSIDDLEKDKQTSWSGVRNYQARNFMRDDMRPGDAVLFYHSSGAPTGIYGLAEVSSLSHVDETQFQAEDEHYDPSVSRQAPRWYCVDLRFKKKFSQPIPLEEIKRDAELGDMLLCRRGNRLSVMPVEEKHFKKIITIAARR